MGTEGKRTPQFIRHRVNTIGELSTVRPEFGVEIDLRSTVDTAGALHLSHDPWKKGDDFVEWLRTFTELNITGPIILNTKEDGLEGQILERLNDFGITRFVFLDTTPPTLVRWVRKGFGKRFAVRLSSFEPEEALNTFRGQIQWVWVDCFDGEPLPVERINTLKPSFDICLVSPEMQGSSIEHITRFGELYRIADAVCTKCPEVWMETFRNQEKPSG